MKSRIFRTKSLDDAVQDTEIVPIKLKRALGPFHLTLLGIGAIIGAGIFATIGTAAAGDPFRPGAGPAIIVSFIITAIVCGFAALCYAEFASMVPISGSAYTYSYTTLGELIAWIIGWDLIIEYAVGNIAVAISWANYFKTLLRGFGIIVPDWLSMDYRTAAKIVDESGVQTVFRDAPHILGVPIVFNVLSIAIVAFLTMVLVWGIRESSRFNALMVGIKILVLGFFVVVGAVWLKPENWTPFAPNGWPGISAGAAIVFFAYIGFDAVSTTAEETRNPKRDLPIGIIASLVICTLVYIIVSAVFTGLIPFSALQTKLATEQAEPLTMALDYASPTLAWAVGIVAFGSVVAHTAVLLVFQLGQPRILFSMARDGLLPKAFRKVHPRFRTPHVSTILTGLFVGGFAAIASLDEMVDLTNIGTLFAFIVVSAGIIVLRIREPKRERPFRIPGGLIIPILSIVSCLYLIYYLPPTSWLRFAAWLNFGFVIYVCYSAVNSRLTGRKTAEIPELHDLHTARIGIWLACVGSALLFVMHGFDTLLNAYRAETSLQGLAQLKSAFHGLAMREAWFEVSWFLLIPLLLNTLVLIPVVIKRARGVVRKGLSLYAMSSRKVTTFAIIFEIMAGIYILLTVLHNASI